MAKTKTLAGKMQDYCYFQREARTSDGGGGYSLNWSTYAEVWGQLMIQPGREQLQAGRLESSVTAVLRIRYSPDVEVVTTNDRILIGSDVWTILTIENIDRNQDYFELLVQKGAAT